MEEETWFPYTQFNAGTMTAVLPVSTLQFDPFQELLWVANENVREKKILE